MSEARKRCYVHVGLPKTGTSYLQSIFFQSTEALAPQDLSMLPDTTAATFHLMLNLRGSLREGMDPRPAFTAVERLPRQAGRVQTSKALMTQELLSAAGPAQVERLVGQLAGWEVHVIVTLRDLSRQLPSAWQQRIKARNVDSYHEFLTAVRERSRPANAFWNTQDPLGVLGRWGTQVPPERTHVVTVPAAGSPPELLLTRFCSVLDVDPATLTTTTVDENTSLGLVQAELLRRVNVALGDRLPHPRSGYRRVGKGYLARHVLSPQRGTPPRVPTGFADWCAETSQTWIDALGSGGFDVVGDLYDLMPGAGSFTEADQLVTDADVSVSATDALATMIDTRLAELRDLDALKQRLADQERELAALRQGQPGLLRRARSRIRRG
ncbi:MAG: hypothetical protein ACRDQ0_17160 [Pseudonocardia sp.]